MASGQQTPGSPSAKFEDVLVEGDMLIGGTLLPSFEMAVVEIFAV
ncbi:MAG: hypothetical protein SF029_09795 [bacterium]|nr:hypothetical protein [bacterium]